MKTNIFLIISILIVFGCGFFLGQANKNTIVKKQIDSLYLDRIEYIRDTIEVERVKTKTKYNIDTLYINTTFLYGSDSSKIALFDSIYPKTDTNWLMRITTEQAKKAVLRNEDAIRDSALLVTEIKNSKNCDTTLKTVVKEVEKIVEPKSLIKDIAIGGLILLELVTLIFH